MANIAYDHGPCMINIEHKKDKDRSKWPKRQRQIKVTKKTKTDQNDRNDKDRYTRVGKCHGYGGYIRVKILASWGKKFGRLK